jgi:hypothetical protein
MALKKFQGFFYFKFRVLLISASCELPPDADRFIKYLVGFSINFVGNSSVMNINERSETGKVLN